MNPNQNPPTFSQTPIPQPNVIDQATAPNQQSQQNPSQPVKFVGFGRLSALLIDLVIVLVICIPIVYITDKPYLQVLKYPRGAERDMSDAIFGLVELIYSVFFVALFGATPGKMLLKMKIVDKNYVKPHLWQVILRESLGKYISGLLFLISGLLVVFNKQKRSIHDFIAGTFVIYK